MSEQKSSSSSNIINRLKRPLPRDTLPRQNTPPADPNKVYPRPPPSYNAKASTQLTPITSSSIAVSPRQRGNPVLSHIKSVPWSFSDIAADYLVMASTSVDPSHTSPPFPASATTTNVLFLSLKYHRLHPEYIHMRIGKLGTTSTDPNKSSSVPSPAILRVLLVMIDIEQPDDTLREIYKIAFARDMSVVLAWNFEDAARYLMNFKLMQSQSLDPSLNSFNALTGTSIVTKNNEDKPSGADLAAMNYEAHLIDVVTKIRGVNKTDAISLISQYGSLSNALINGPKDLESIGGWGSTKVERFKEAVTEPFILIDDEEEEEEEERKAPIEKLSESANLESVVDEIIEM